MKPLFKRFTFVVCYQGSFHFDSLLSMPEPPVSSRGFPLNLSQLHAFLFETVPM